MRRSDVGAKRRHGFGSWGGIEWGGEIGIGDTGRGIRCK